MSDAPAEPTAQRWAPTAEQLASAAERGAAAVRWGWWVTAGFALVAALATAFRALRWGAAAYEIAMLVAGTALFGAGFLRAARRSREEVLTVAGTFFLLDGVAANTRRVLLGQVGVQVGLALAAAGLRRYAAFAILAPVFGVGLMAWWGARWGLFPPRNVPRTRLGPGASAGR